MSSPTSRAPAWPSSDHPPTVPLPRAPELLVPDNVLAIIQANPSKGKLAPVADGVGFPGGHDVVAGLRLLQHQVHGPHVVAGKAPVAKGIEVSQAKLGLLSSGDGDRPLHDLLRDK